MTLSADDAMAELLAEMRRAAVRLDELYAHAQRVTPDELRAAAGDLRQLIDELDLIRGLVDPATADVARAYLRLMHPELFE